MAERPPRDGTRDRILIAAATMLGENPAARLSVRAVAARAGVSTGSLRHFFPTQRALIDTVVAGLYDLDIPDDPIHDAARTPAERLVGCLRLMLAEVGTGDRARARWRSTYETYIASDPTDDDAAAYFALERLGLHRIERWLSVLVDEGSVPVGAVEGHARFLATVLTGLAAERALPAEASRVDHETRVLRIAVDAVVRAPEGDGKRA